LAPDSETRIVQVSTRFPWQRLLAVGFAVLAVAAAGALSAAAANEGPTKLWAEYPLDPAGDGSALELEPSSSDVAGDAVQSSSRAAISAPGEESGVPSWTVPLVVFAVMALTGMAWLSMAAMRKDSHWKTAPSVPPRTRRRRPPVMSPSSNGASAETSAQTSAQTIEPKRAGGIRYRD
jgi:hypothetical protein